MKRLITAVSFAVLAVPALAAPGAPFEQTELDRALPNVEVKARDARVAQPSADYSVIAPAL